MFTGILTWLLPDQILREALQDLTMWPRELVKIAVYFLNVTITSTCFVIQCTIWLWCYLVEFVSTGPLWCPTLWPLSQRFLRPVCCPSARVHWSMTGDQSTCVDSSQTPRPTLEWRCPRIHSQCEPHQTNRTWKDRGKRIVSFWNQVNHQ